MSEQTETTTRPIRWRDKTPAEGKTEPASPVAKALAVYEMAVRHYREALADYEAAEARCAELRELVATNQQAVVTTRSELDEQLRRMDAGAPISTELVRQNGKAKRPLSEAQLAARRANQAKAVAAKRAAAEASATAEAPTGE